MGTREDDYVHGITKRMGPNIDHMVGMVWNMKLEISGRVSGNEKKWVSLNGMRDEG